VLVWDQNIETMKTTEQLAEERYPYSMQRLLWSKTDKGRHEHAVDLQRLAHATCIHEEVEPLEAWKESAIKVMGEWDKVWEALGNPGKLGESMAAASVAEIERLRALVQVIGDAFVLADNGRVQTDGTKQAVGHAHDIHAVWDMDNRKELAGKPCQKCLAFDAARIALKEAGFVPTNTTEG